MGVKISGLDAVHKQIKKLSTLDKPVNSAIKKSANSLRTLASKVVRDEVTLGKPYTDSLINRKMVFITPNNPTGEIGIYLTKKGVLFDRFKFSVNNKGKVKMKIKKEGGMLDLDNAFMFKLKSGRKVPVFRKGKGKYAFAMYGPSPSQIINTKRDEIKEEGAKVLQKNIDHNIRWHLNGK